MRPGPRLFQLAQSLHLRNLMSSFFGAQINQ